jgi:hypothetical protein
MREIRATFLKGAQSGGFLVDTRSPGYAQGGNIAVSSNDDAFGRRIP